MSPSATRLRILTLAAVLCLASALPALAGPPLLCHPFDIGGATSLPWDNATGLSTGRADYPVSRVIADTEALLTPATPVIVRMETLRRAAIYASQDREVASALLSRLVARTRASARPSTPDPLAYLDAAYVAEAFRQIGMLGRSAGFAARAPIAAAVAAGTDGLALMDQGLAARPGDAALEFAAALMSADKSRAAYDAHARNARTLTSSDPLLARNLHHVS